MGVGSVYYSAEYGNLRLEVSAQEQAGMFEFRVLDKLAGATVWVGSAPDLETAQSSALFEAQTFVGDPRVASPHWLRRAVQGHRFSQLRFFPPCSS
jgi:hypothetical protein